MGVGIIFNEIVINKTVFRIVLLLFIDGKYFNLSSAIFFVFVFNKARAKLKITKQNLPSSYLVELVVNSFR